MSDPLAEAAPASHETVPSVEDQALSTEGKVDVGSGSGEDVQYVEAKRFNGLMANFNKEQAARSAAEQRAAELEERLAAAETQLTTPTATQEESPVPETENELRQQVEQLTQAVSQLVQGTQDNQAEQIRQKVLEEFPEAEPFADLIFADDEDGLREVASDIAARVAKLNGNEGAPAKGEPAPSESAAEAAPVNPDIPAVPATPGGGPVTEQPQDDAARQAIKEGDFAKWAAARHGGADDEGLVLETA